MKKRLESELISIAHRILKLKNKSEVDQLQLEAKKLYETLTVLKFYGDNYEQLKSELSAEDFEDKLANSISEEKAIVVEEAKVEEKEIPQEIVAEEVEQIANIVEEDIIEETPIVAEEEVVFEEQNEVIEKEESFDAIFELASVEMNDEVEEVEEVIVAQPESKVEKENPKQISLEDFLNENYTEPVFVKPNDNVKKQDTEVVLEEVKVAKVEGKSKSLNDMLSKGINIGLNDRIAFVKHLFGESNEDFNRVISQLNTFDSLDEAKTFIEEMVKPDYNDWNGKDDYALRFTEMVEKKFA